MIPVKTITFPYSESSHIKHGTVVKSWAKADEVLRHAAHWAPDTGAYDKTDFEVVWEDGTVYGGRFDLQARHEVMTNLINGQIFRRLMIQSGRWKPHWMNRLRYQAIMEGLSEEDRAAAIKMLDQYDLELNNHD